jgi:hypothetical protein
MNFLFRLVTLNSFTKEFKVGATNTKFVFENEGLNEAQVEIFQFKRDQFKNFTVLREAEITEAEITETEMTEAEMTENCIFYNSAGLCPWAIGFVSASQPPYVCAQLAMWF